MAGVRPAGDPQHHIDAQYPSGNGQDLAPTHAPFQKHKLGKENSDVIHGEARGGKLKGQLVDAHGKLGHKKQDALVALLSHRSIDDAARACNMRPRTLYRWLKEPDFEAAYREARLAAFAQSIARLQQATSLAA